MVHINAAINSQRTSPLSDNKLYPAATNALAGYPISLLAHRYGGPTFHKHQWKIFIYVSIKNYKGFGIKLYHKEDLIISGSMSSNTSLVDIECKVCHHYSSQVGNDDIKGLIEHESALVNFFNYYQDRCPAPAKKDADIGDFSHHFHEVKVRKEGKKDEKKSEKKGEKKERKRERKRERKKISA